MQHVYTESVHSGDKSMFQVLHTYAHTTGLLPQTCALPGVLHGLTAKNEETHELE